MKKNLLPHMLGVFLFAWSCTDSANSPVDPAAKKFYDNQHSAIADHIRAGRFWEVGGGETYCRTRLLGGSAGELYIYYLCEAVSDSGEVLAGTAGPAQITYNDQDILESKFPRDGSGYSEDLALLFPKNIRTQFLEKRDILNDITKELSNKTK